MLVLESSGSGFELVDGRHSDLVGKPGIGGAQCLDGGGPNLFGQHGVVSPRHGEETLGCAENEHGVEIMADRTGERPNHDALPESAMASAGDVEFGGQRSHEHGGGWRRIARIGQFVERGQSDQRRFHSLEGHLLGFGPRLVARIDTEKPHQQILRCPGHGRPGVGLVDVTDPLDQAGDKRFELIEIVQPIVPMSGVGLGQPLVDGRSFCVDLREPVGDVSQNTDLSRQCVPRRGPDPLGPRSKGTTGDERHDAVSTPALLGKTERSEKRAARHRVAQTTMVGTVEHQVRCGEVLLDDAQVRVGGRKEDADSVQWHAVGSQGHDLPGDHPYLFGRVGDRHDVPGGCRLGDRIESSSRGSNHAGGLDAAQHRFVCLGSTGEPEDHGCSSRIVQGTIDEPAEGRRDRRRQVPDEVSERGQVVGEMGAIGGRIGEVGFGVEPGPTSGWVGGEVSGNGGIETDGELSRVGFEFSDGLDAIRIDVGQLGEERRQGGFGCLVLGNRPIGAGVVGKRLANGSPENGIGDGAGVEEQIGTDQLGQLEGGHERDIGQACTRCAEHSADGETDEVAGNDHGDRRQRPGLLGLRQCGTKRIGCRPSVRHDGVWLDHVYDHTPTV